MLIGLSKSLCRPSTILLSVCFLGCSGSQSSTQVVSNTCESQVMENEDASAKRDLRSMIIDVPPKSRNWDERNEFPTTCSLHGTEMETDSVPIKYGLALSTGESWREIVEMLRRSTRYPNSNRYYEGGCVRCLAESALVRYCPKCRKVEDNFFKQKYEPDPE